MNNLGEQIKKYRKEKNLSQIELGRLICVSDKTISSWENNRTVPDFNTIFMLADIFQTSFYTLVYNDYCNSDNIELEVKLKVSSRDWNRVLNIMKNKALYLGKDSHSATYYNSKNYKFDNEWLRIRNENGKFILNYKKQIDKNCCTEYETLIDNKDYLENILLNLNFQKIGNVNKKREKYLYNNKYEFAFDCVENIGLFIEIEVKKVEFSYEKEYDFLIKLLKELDIDLNLIDNKRYPDYLNMCLENI